jgi:hypothetical protein
MAGIGRLPAGNTGGANVSGFHAMLIPRDLQRAMDAAQSKSPMVSTDCASPCGTAGTTP